jgi:hypothetical protein
MISVQTVVDRLAFVLDAEDSERYTFENDYKPAINSSVEWLQAVFNKAFADKKLTEEDLKELIKVTVFQTSQYSRINLDLITDSIWSLLRINPEPVLHPAGATITTTANPEQSLWRSDLSYIKGKFATKLLSLEQWEESVDNVFAAGNERLLNSFKSYAYLNFAGYGSSSYDAGGPEIEIRPEIPNEFVGVTYLKYPTPVAVIGDEIELPKSLTNLVFEKAANFIAWKQGDQTNLYAVSEKDVMTLIKLMI